MSALVPRPPQSLPPPKVLPDCFHSYFLAFNIVQFNEWDSSSSYECAVREVFRKLEKCKGLQDMEMAEAIDNGLASKHEEIEFEETAMGNELASEHEEIDVEESEVEVEVEVLLMEGESLEAVQQEFDQLAMKKRRRQQ